MRIRTLTIGVALLCCLSGAAQPGFGGPAPDPSVPRDLTTESWYARWISVPDTDPQGYGVYYFRKTVNLDAVPSAYKVNVTGDNRYKLYVNGTLVSLGPARGDATHWNYEQVDLAPYLHPGDNMLTAIVFHEGKAKPEANVSVSAGFLLQGIDEACMLITDKSWQCAQDKSYSPVQARVPGYYVSGPGEQVDFCKHPEDWASPDCKSVEWTAPAMGPAGSPKDLVGNSLSNSHALVRSILPQMERTPERLQTVRKDGGLKIPAGFLAGTEALVIPAHTETEIILDQTYLTNAYFNVALAGGAGAELRIGYTEAFYEPSESRFSSNKGDRDVIEGKTFIGREDVLLPDGAAHEYTTLAWRTYRYVRLVVKTADEALTLSDIHGVFVGYPFVQNASVESEESPEMTEMFNIGWRTARLCAIETYMDCPYYEQLQYLGDTRIQALVSLYNSGDDRLVKNFLRLSDISRNPEGITMGRYPTSSPQYITPYALSYVYAIHDYMMYGKDPQFVLSLLPGAEQILWYFTKYQGEDGRIVNLPGWNFSDWVYTDSWNFGSPLKGSDGSSILMDLQLLYGFQMMADIENYAGRPYVAKEYADKASKLAAAVKQAYWSSERGLFSDRAEKDNFSQHANSLAILCGLVEGDEAKAVAEKLLSDSTLSPCSVYYKFYLHQALVKAGLGDRYMDWLDIWRENIRYHLTTWGETSDVNGTRSDCHAWGASPNIEFLRTVAGIDSAAPGFSEVVITPRLGELKHLNATMPHPAGSISVSYTRKGSTLKAEVTLPEGVEGTIVWNGQTRKLVSGKNTLNIK